MTLFVFLVPLWLLGVILPSALTPEDVARAQFASFVWLPIAGALAGGSRFLMGRLFRKRTTILVLAIASILSISASAILSEDPLISLGFVITAAIGIVCCAGLWELIGHRMATSLQLYAWLGTALCAYAYYASSRVQGRLTIGDAHPNYLGVISFGILTCALLVKERIFATLLVTANLYIIIQTESRSALGAALIAIVVYVCLTTVHIRTKRAALAVSAAFVASAASLLVYYDYVQAWFSSVFFLNDRYRGLGTGFTGRIGSWQEALDLFMQNPVFGVGFRMHERYMVINSSAHNGYLSLLAEAGLAGAVPLIILTILLISLLTRKALGGDQISIVGISFVAGYLFIAAFERLFLNMGNPTSILTWVFLLSSDAIRIRSRAPAMVQFDIAHRPSPINPIGASS